MIKKEILPYSSRKSPDYFLQNKKRIISQLEKENNPFASNKLDLYFLLSDEFEKPHRENGSTDYVIPYIRNNIINVFNQEPSPYMILDRFIYDLAAKLKFLPQY